MRKRLFLVMNPDWDVRQDVEHHAATVADALDMAIRDVRGRLLKPGATLIKQDTDLPRLDAARQALVDAGYDAVIVSERELREPERPGRAVSLRTTGRAIEFLDLQDNVIMRVGGQSRLLVVVGDLDMRRDEAVRSLLHNERQSKLQRLTAFCAGRTVIRLFDDSGGQGVFIKDRGFRFPSLGKGAGLSSTRNVRLLLDRTIEAAGEVSIDVDFGMADELPVNVRPPVPEAEEKLCRFERHALTTLAMWREGLIGPTDLKDLEPTGEKTGLTKSPIVTAGSPEGREAFQFLGFGPRFRSALNRMGPVWLALALLGGVVGGILGLRVSADPAYLGVSAISAGTMFLLYGFGSFKRKRLIEDYPISRIRSLAMGRVEVSGTAVPRITMRSPYGDVECVYFRYQLQEFIQNMRGRTTWTTVASGSSGAVPFGIRDDTGEVMVIPRGAQMDLRSRRTIPVTKGSSDLGAATAVSGKMRAIEEYIPTWGEVCVMGTARPIQSIPTDHRRALALRLRALKRDKEALARFDANGDGRIDEKEWEAAVAKIRSEILEAGRGEGPEARDKVLIGAGDPGSLFMIWEGDEARFISGLAASAWIGMIAGVLLFGCGVWLAAL
ncbi:MAG: hypothetical protein GXP54_03980 [Deltaproteobacteria bacterium]|nr:hypothetical protein [Deltaproteobacteria bacterium]